MKTQHVTLRTWRWLFAVLLASFALVSGVQAAAGDISVLVSNTRPIAKPGDTVTFIIEVASTTGSDVPSVDIDVLLPAGLSYISSSPTLSGGTPGSVPYSLTLATVTNGSPSYVYLTAKVDTGVANNTPLTVTVSSTFLSSNVTNSITVQLPQASFDVTSLSYGSVAVGNTSDKVAKIQNNGQTNLQISSISAAGNTTAGDFSVVSASCTPPVSLLPNQECSITVRFSPQPGSVGARTGTLTVASDASPANITLNLSGTGLAPVSQLVGTVPLSFGQQPINTSTTNQSVGLKNVGNASMSITSITSSDAAFIVSDTCPDLPSKLTANVTCQINVRFQPTATGAQSAIITAVTDGGNQTFSVSGTGTNAGMSLSPTSINFGSQAVTTQSAPQVVTIQNTGTTDLILSNISVSSGFVITGQTCQTSVPITTSSTCTVTVAFAPTQQITYNGSLSFADNTATGSHSVALSGTGGAPSVSFNPSSLSFASQFVASTSAAQNITLTNNGNAPLTIFSVQATGDFAVSSTNCPISPSSLASSASCTIAVTFTPTTSGTRSGIITVSDNANGPHIANLSGLGVARAPAVSLSASQLDFGQVAYGATSAPQNITLTNSGSADLTISSISADGDFQVSANTCTSPITEGSTCQISVTFTPATGGTRSGTLSIVDNASGSPHTVSLSGVGQASHFDSTPGVGAVSMSSVIGGMNSVQLTIRNTGNVQLDISAPTSALVAPFTISPSNAFSLGSNQSATLTITCAPTGAGPFSQTLGYTTNDPALPTASYALTCTGTNQATATYASAPAPGSTIDFGSLTNGNQASQVLQVTETGSAALQVDLAGGSLASALTGAGARSFSLNELAFPFTIGDGGAAHDVAITCRPMAAGTVSADLALSTNDPAQPQVHYTLTCTGTGSFIFYAYAPQVTLATPPADLVVSSFTINTKSLAAGDPVRFQAIVQNTGGSDASGFWVDLYINPKTVPTTANLAWNETCGLLDPCYGIAWYVDSLPAGGSVILTSDSGKFFGPNSNWVGTLAAGTTDVYIYADSWNRDDTNGTRIATGAVLEGNEQNNRAEIHSIAVRSGKTLATTRLLTFPARPQHP